MLSSINSLNKFSKIEANELEKYLARMIFDKGSTNDLTNAASVSRDRIIEMIKKVNKGFTNRKKAIETVIAGLVSGISVVLFGPPGTAKSALIRKITSFSGLNSYKGKYFEYLLTNHTMPEEIFGSVNLEELSKGRIKRETANKLPNAEIAFLDELFRGGSHILNTLLTIINEKRYDSGDGMKQVPLLGLIGASNSVPTDPDLEAFYDRFPVRVWLSSIFDTTENNKTKLDSNLKKLIEQSIQNERERIFSSWNSEESLKKEEDEVITCTNDFRVVRAYLISNIENSTTERENQYSSLFKSVRERCKLSDRSYGFLWLYAAAYDYIRGKDIFSSYPTANGHIEIFEYVSRNMKDITFLKDKIKKITENTNHTTNI